MAKKKEEPEEAKEEKSEDIVEEEKPKEKDYNSIFEDDYDEDDEKDSTDEVEEEEPGEEPEFYEEAEEDDEPEEERAKEKPKKKETKKVSKKKSKGLPTKKVLIIVAAIFVLLLGAFLGMLFYKNTNKPKEETTTTTTTTEPEVKKEVYVTADGGLNMRENPDKNAKVVILIPKGTKLTVLEEQDGWYKVEYNGKTGWVSKDFVSEQKPDDRETYTGNGFSADNPKFSIKYPSDWALSGYKVSKTDAGKKYTVAFGEGGHGFAEDENSGIVSTQEDITVNGLAGKKTIAKKDNKIVVLVTQFLKGDSYINIEFAPPEGYDDSYIDTYNKIVETFKFI